VQNALVGAPGSLRVVDEKTLYFRPPAGYLEPEVLLMVLRNLMYAAYQREQKGEPHPAPVAQPDGDGRKEKLRSSGGGVRVGPAVPPRREPRPAEPTREMGHLAKELENLASLHAAGILTDDEFEKAKSRIVARA